MAKKSLSCFKIIYTKTMGIQIKGSNSLLGLKYRITKSDLPTRALRLIRPYLANHHLDAILPLCSQILILQDHSFPKLRPKGDAIYSNLLDILEIWYNISYFFGMTVLPLEYFPVPTHLPYPFLQLENSYSSFETQCKHLSSMKSSLTAVCRVTPSSKLYIPRTIFHHNYLFITLYPLG